MILLLSWRTKRRKINTMLQRIDKFSENQLFAGGTRLGRVGIGYQRRRLLLHEEHDFCQQCLPHKQNLLFHQLSAIACGVSKNYGKFALGIGTVSCTLTSTTLELMYAETWLAGASRLYYKLRKMNKQFRRVLNTVFIIDIEAGSAISAGTAAT